MRTGHYLTVEIHAIPFQFSVRQRGERTEKTNSGFNERMEEMEMRGSSGKPQAARTFR